VRLVGHLDHRGVADRESGAGRQLGPAEVEVDEELVPGERPALRIDGDECGGPGVHQRQLPIGVRCAAGAPVVADESDLGVELRGLANFALVDHGTAHDQLQCAPADG
jgi:hypothetical protein